MHQCRQQPAVPTRVRAGPLRPVDSGSRARRPLAPARATPGSGGTVYEPKDAALISEAEKFVLEMSAEEAAAEPAQAFDSSELQAQLQQLKDQVGGETGGCKHCCHGCAAKAEEQGGQTSRGRGVTPTRPPSCPHHCLQAAGLGSKIDALYSSVFVGVELPQLEVPTGGADDRASSEAEAAAALQAQLAQVLPDPSQLTEAGFGELGRTAPKVRSRWCSRIGCLRSNIC